MSKSPFDKKGKSRSCVKSNLGWFQRFLVAEQILKRWSDISASILQNEHKGVSVFPNCRSFLFKHSTLIKHIIDDFIVKAP